MSGHSTMAYIALKMPIKLKIEGHRINILNIVSSVKLNGMHSGDKNLTRNSVLNDFFKKRHKVCLHCGAWQVLETGS